MDIKDIMATIHSRLSPVEVKDWFVAVSPEIKQEVAVLANVDGIDVAVKEVKALYIAWLQQPRKV